jgi:3'-phosphoadenosine 5'-phosphosulfate sulfotransferase (PAPS reductase)/FAD synthetase
MRLGIDLCNEAVTILNDAIRDHGPRAIYIMLSGGNDSRTVATLAHNLLNGRRAYKGAALMDTGIALAEAQVNVANFAAALGCPLTVVKTPQDYETLVRKHGFPGPAQHTMMYRNLKERAVRVLTKHAKSMRRDRVLLISGVRQTESVKRMLLDSPVQRDGARVWVNPLFYWTTPERDAYMEAHGIERNPISGKICGTSGDCLCGCNAEEGELGDLEFWFPNDPAVQRIQRLQVECATLGVPCKWGHKPSGKPARKRREGRPMFMCVGCENRIAARVKDA